MKKFGDLMWHFFLASVGCLLAILTETPIYLFTSRLKVTHAFAKLEACDPSCPTMSDRMCAMIWRFL